MSGLITEVYAAQKLGISVATLRTWRCTRRVNIPFVKIGKSVRYRPEDLDAFVRNQTIGGAA